MPSAKHTHIRSLSWLIAGLVAFVLSLGVHRSLVVCTGPHCAGVIQWVHDSGDCCIRNHPGNAACGHCEGPHDDDGDHESLRPGDDCSDVPLTLEEGPAPERVVFVAQPAAVATVVDWTPSAPPAPRIVREHAPATGPPRPPRSLTLLATTILLI